MFKTKLQKLLDEVKEEIKVKLSDIDFKTLRTSLKPDKSIVTEMDIYISGLFKEKLNQLDPKLNFYSEEDQECFRFPVVILDPIDGTKEFARGLDECVISFGIYYSEDLHDERNFSWIYNFHNHFEISSDTPFIEDRLKDSKDILGLVSKTEFEAGLYKTGKNIKPVGSIAYKLALLAKRECDFVITKRPKNIWDIAAGAHICLRQKINFFQNNEEKNFVLNNDLYSPSMLWCKKEKLETVKFHI